jgi:hypothetical protein
MRGELGAQYGSGASTLPDDLAALREELTAVMNSGNEYKAENAKAIRDEIDVQLNKIKFVPETIKTETVNTGLLNQRGEPITKEVATLVPGQKGGATGKLADEIKTSLGEKIQDSAYGINARPGEQAKFLKQAQDVAREAARKSLEEEGLRQGVTGVGDKFTSVNKDLGILSEGNDPLFNVYKREAMKPGFTQVDAMALAAGPQYYIGKQAAKLGAGTRATTTAGAILLDPLFSNLLGGSAALTGKALLRSKGDK